MAAMTVTLPNDVQSIVNVNPAMLGQQKPIDQYTASQPQLSKTKEELQSRGITEEMCEDLKEIRRQYIEGDSPKRQAYLRRAMRGFETFKNNPYALWNEGTSGMDTLDEIISALDPDGSQEPDMYQYNDNIYQMLGLTLISALSADVPKCRYQPTDAENESDIRIAEKASIIQAYNERRNNVKSLQKKELLFLWCTGSYFTYTRNLVDADRAGTTNIPVTGMAPHQMSPNRYICPDCGQAQPETDDMSPDESPQCQDCGKQMGAGDWYPSESIMLPVKLGSQQVPNSMTAMDVVCGLNVSVQPDCEELYETPYLDFSIEADVGSVRSWYPGSYQEIQAGAYGDQATSDQMSTNARLTMTAPSGTRLMNQRAHSGTYSRCWLQAKAFNLLDNQDRAETLRKAFPSGCRINLWAGETVLDVVPEKMVDRWTDCRTIKGTGMYPIAIGDAALDVQERINDTANTVHAYMDRMAYGTLLYDSDFIDGDEFARKALTPGNATGVHRIDESGTRVPLSELMFQPHQSIDGHIFQYSQQLVMLMQMIAGVQPQSYGGSDPNVQTASGQAQMLHQAMGRMQLFWDQIREEHAARAVNSVRCTIDNMDAQMKIVVQGDTDDSPQTVKLLRQELTGDFMAYPESDEGFPASYGEVQARIMQLLTMGQKSPVIAAMMSDPDTQKVVARYILPDQITLPGDAERARMKELMVVLSQSGPNVHPPPPQAMQAAQQQGAPPPQPMVLPSIMPSPDYDDMQAATIIAKTWCQKNWRISNTPGFQNVLAFLKICAHQAQQQQIQQQLALQNAAQKHGGGGPPPGAA